MESAEYLQRHASHAPTDRDTGIEPQGQVLHSEEGHEQSVSPRFTKNGPRAVSPSSESRIRSPRKVDDENKPINRPSRERGSTPGGRTTQPSVGNPGPKKEGSPLEEDAALPLKVSAERKCDASAEQSQARPSSVDGHRPSNNVASNVSNEVQTGPRRSQRIRQRGVDMAEKEKAVSGPMASVARN